MFFVLSGFLIFLSIRKNLEANKFHFDIIQFAKSRLIRLYPPLVVSSLIIVIMYWVLNILNLNHANQFATGNEMYLARNELIPNTTDILGSLFFLNTILPEIKTPSLNGPLWSLAHELWFYVVAGLSVISIYKRKFFALLLVVTVFLYYNVNIFWLYGLLVWGSGFYAGWVFTNKNNKDLKHFNVLLIVISGLCWVYMLIGSGDSYFMNNRQKFLFGVFFAVSLPLLLERKGLISKIVGCKLGEKIASMSKFSYTLYLLHFPILLFIFVLTNRITEGHIVFTMLVALSSMWFCILLSSCLGRVVELRSSKIGTGQS